VTLGLGRRSLGGTALALAGGGLLYRSLRGQEQPLPAPGRALLRRYRTRVQAGLKGAQRSVTIQKPANEIHRAWRAEGSLPQVMGHFAEVTELSPDRHRWKVRGPPGTSLEWESHIVEEHSGELLRWEAVEGAVLPNEGLLRFLPAPVDRGTVMTLKLRFDPPAGPAGDAMMRLMGDVSALALKALRRFKSLAEAGEIPATHFTPAARDDGYSD
jgi:uncharacterized membrane protein